MHTPAPPDTQFVPPACLHGSPQIHRKRSGFSLIEVTLAIAIVAFAFIALKGLLPAGMSVFNQTMDATNEMRISSDITSILQSTEYSKIPTNPEIINNNYYFDVDGSLVDTDMDPAPGRVEERIYVARIFVDKQNIPAAGINDFYDRDTIALKTLVLVGRNNPATYELLKAVSDVKDIWKLPRQKVRVLPLVITKTDGKI